MAAIVPMGIDFWASRRSPERLEPAIIPVSGQRWNNQEFMSGVRVKRKPDKLINEICTRLHRIIIIIIIHTIWPYICITNTSNIDLFYVFLELTCDGWKVYPDQQREEAGNICQDVAVGGGWWTVWICIWCKPALLNNHPFLQVVTKQVL